MDSDGIATPTQEAFNFDSDGIAIPTQEASNFAIPAQGGYNLYSDGITTPTPSISIHPPPNATQLIEPVNSNSRRVFRKR